MLPIRMHVLDAVRTRGYASKKRVRESMFCPYLRTSRRRVLFIGVLLPFQLFLSISAYARQGSSSDSSGRITTGAIVVIVRDERGEPLTIPATVSLSSSDGLPVAQLSVINGGQATFRNVRPGSYKVEVEASG